MFNSKTTGIMMNPSGTGRSVINLLPMLFLLVVSFASFGQDPDVIAIRLLLRNQTTAWNSGNIDEFMKGYWKNDSLVFIGKKGPKYGYTKTLANYKKNYPKRADMGQLHFDLMEIKRLCPEFYFVTGKWGLLRSKGNLQGFFTLLFRKIDHNWVIVSDHTS
jgi:hypothetical protein